MTHEEIFNLLIANSDVEADSCQPFVMTIEINNGFNPTEFQVRARRENAPKVPIPFEDAKNKKYKILQVLRWGYKNGNMYPFELYRVKDESF